MFESVALLRAALVSSGGGRRIDPDSLMEQAYATWNGLLSQPVPANELPTALAAQIKSAPSPAAILPPTLRPASAALSFPQCIETAMRICLLLYVKRMSLYQEDIAWTQPSLMGVCIYCCEQVLNTLETCGYRADGTTPHNHSRSFVDEVIDSTRPALIWISVMGWTCLQMLFAKKRDLLASSRLLVLLVGTDESSVDALPDSDFELCRIYDPNDITPHHWDARRTIKDMIKYSK
ncbi:hypothetical protein BX600DRAFT_158282 [Xylariales sp. PMI_506]|nr:hypothetical protein BX600DRAFT_158282 [Xylariales sp. PMI_506]